VQGGEVVDFYIDIGIAVILRVLKDRKKARQYFDAFAKVYVRIAEVAAIDQELAAAIARQKAKQ